MSAAAALVSAVLATLADESRLAELCVFDAPPVRALAPYAVVEHPQFRGADAAGVTGRIGTLAIGFQDAGEAPTRLRVLMAGAEEAMDLLPAALGDGWRLAGIELARSRLARAKEGWLGRSEWAVRVFRVN